MIRKIVPVLSVLALCAAWAFVPRPGERLSAQPAGVGQKKMPKLLTSKPLETEGEKDQMARLLRQRYNAALEEVRLRYKQFSNNTTGMEPMLDACRRLLASGATAITIGRNRIEFLESYLELTEDLAARSEQYAKSGQGHQAEAAQARYMVLDARIQLLHAQRRLAGPGPLPVP